VAITPGGVPYEAMAIEDVVVVDLEKNVIEGIHKPSSETPMHIGIYREMPKVNGVVHTHSLYATAFAAAAKEIPPINIMAVIIGGSVPVAGYEIPGTEAIGKAAMKAIGNKNAVLLQNHGVLTIGPTLKFAFEIALRVEELAQMAYLASQIGKPIALSEKHIAELREMAGLKG
jgi:L-ribulose-5-phosphate 4-epimerase